MTLDALSHFCSADVLLKYNADEARILQKRGHLPKDIVVEDGEKDGQGQEDDLGFEFTDRGIDSDSEENEVGSQPASRLKALPAYSDSWSDSEDGDSVDLDKL